MKKHLKMQKYLIITVTIFGLLLVGTFSILINTIEKDNNCTDFICTLK